jgi:hypothetical protein
VHAACACELGPLILQVRRRHELDAVARRGVEVTAFDSHLVLVATEASDRPVVSPVRAVHVLEERVRPALTVRERLSDARDTGFPVRFRRGEPRNVLPSLLHARVAVHRANEVLDLAFLLVELRTKISDELLVGTGLEPQDGGVSLGHALLSRLELIAQL